MKAILSLIILVILSSSSAAQKNGQPTIGQGLYYRALVAALAARAHDSKSADVNDPLHQVIIEKDDQLNAGFPRRIGDVGVEYLTLDELRVRYLSLKHTFPIFVMRPIANEDDRIVVNFTRYLFSATKKTNAFALEGGYRVVLRYDCSQKQFVVESAKLWGI